MGNGETEEYLLRHEDDKAVTNLSVETFETNMEHNLFRLIKGYEKKIDEKDENLTKLQKMYNNRQEQVRGYDITIKYYLSLIGINLLLFPTIGYFTGSIITGVSFWIVSSSVIALACAVGSRLKHTASRKSDDLSLKIDDEEQSKKEYERELNELKKHITPMHIDFNSMKQSNALGQLSNVHAEEIEEHGRDVNILGPTLVKRKKRVSRDSEDSNE